VASATVASVLLEPTWQQPTRAFHVLAIVLCECVQHHRFFLWNSARIQEAATAKYPTNSSSERDANGDGVTDGQDFILWNDNKFMSADRLSAIPEPGAAMLSCVGLFLMCLSLPRWHQGVR
jgi:hypothetical protein